MKSMNLLASMVVGIFVHNFYKKLYFLILFFFSFLWLFMFWEEREIKERKNTNLLSFLIEVDNRTLTKLISDG